MSEKTQAQIPYSMLEYSVVLKKPLLEAWIVPAHFISAVLKALEPFGFKTEGVEINTRSEKLSEYAVSFRRTPPGVTFKVGIEKLVITAENLDWGDAQHFINGSRAGINAIVEKASPDILSHHLALGIHIQLKNRLRQEVTAPLLSPTALKLLDGDLKMPGIIIQRENCSIVVDASVAFANGLFVRIIREHGPSATFEQMAEVLRNDEQQLFDVLGLEGDL